eukprot:769165-Pleurochrysis_carterae.AAC.4
MAPGLPMAAAAVGAFLVVVRGTPLADKMMATVQSSRQSASVACAALASWLLLSQYRRLRRGLTVKGRVALVTGASSGAGAATCIELARRGAAGVILVGRDPGRLAETAQKVEAAGGTVLSVHSRELSDQAEVDALISDLAASAHGMPSLVFQCAGAGRWRSLTEMSSKEAVGCLDAPLISSMLLSRALLPHLVKLPCSAMVYAQSPVSRVVPAGCTAYAAARFALRGLVEAIAADCSGTSIRICEVKPARERNAIGNDTIELDGTQLLRLLVYGTSSSRHTTAFTQVVLNEISDSGYFSADSAGRDRIPAVKVLLGPAISSAQAACALVDAVERGNRCSSAPSLLALNLALQPHFETLYRWLTVGTSKYAFGAQG